MSSVGQPNLNQVLAQLVPSFSTAGFGADSAQLTLSSSLRGLNPNHTLVLVNGKRRHGTANLQARPSAAQGGAAPDLDFIPAASIDRIEVLEDGAARSEERRVGTECVSTCSTRWSPDTSKKNKTTN